MEWRYWNKGGRNWNQFGTNNDPTRCWTNSTSNWLSVSFWRSKFNNYFQLATCYLAMKKKKLNACIGAIKQLSFAWLNAILMITVVCLNAGETKINATKVSLISEFTKTKIFRMSLQRKMSKWMWWYLSTLELSRKSKWGMSNYRNLSSKRGLPGSRWE